jgi:hypothetical protein
MKRKDVSLISDETCDYYFPDIVNKILRDQDGNVTMVSELDATQVKETLILFVVEYAKLQKKLTKLVDYVNKEF